MESPSFAWQPTEPTGHWASSYTILRKICIQPSEHIRYGHQGTSFLETLLLPIQLRTNRQEQDRTLPHPFCLAHRKHNPKFGYKDTVLTASNGSFLKGRAAECCLHPSSQYNSRAFAPGTICYCSRAVFLWFLSFF